MSDNKPANTAKRGIRWGRMFWTLVILALIGGGLYASSWFNARRYFLLVGESEVRVAKGRMLPIGHEPFIPQEIDLRRAYQSFPLPSGIKVPRGETMFSDRVELDQALFRLLKDAIAFSLMEDNRRTPELVQLYMKQIKSIPGTSVAQQLELAQLERDSQYVEARQQLGDAIKNLKEASRLFRESARGQGGHERDGDTRAQTIESALRDLERVSPPEPPADREVKHPTSTSTVSSSAADRRSLGNPAK
jgi:hypothetical protein